MVLPTHSTLEHHFPPPLSSHALNSLCSRTVSLPFIHPLYSPPLSTLCIHPLFPPSVFTPLRQAYHGKFGREVANDGKNGSIFQAKKYLIYQGAKFIERFDPVTYVKITGK